MAAGSVPIPGSLTGPCEPQCAHVDCAFQRKLAASCCRICGKPIGYENRFYQDPKTPTGTAWVHAICIE